METTSISLANAFDSINTAATRERKQLGADAKAAINAAEQSILAAMVAVDRQRRPEVRSAK